MSRGCWCFSRQPFFRKHNTATQKASSQKLQVQLPTRMMRLKSWGIGHPNDETEVLVFQDLLLIHLFIKIRVFQNHLTSSLPKSSHQFICQRLETDPFGLAASSTDAHPVPSFHASTWTALQPLPLRRSARRGGAHVPPVPLWDRARQHHGARASDVRAKRGSIG